VLETAWEQCYKPLIEVLKRHPCVRVGFHISGCLLEWLADAHPETLDDVFGMCRNGTLELLSSGYFEPLLPIFRREDVLRQIREFSSLLADLSGRKPEGLWLTERVWEPGLASLIVEAGLGYAVVDDYHLMIAGVPSKGFFQPWITEDSGRSLSLLPSNGELRYMIPFTPVASVMDTLRNWHEAGRKLAFYGDDGEKFGVWPGTHELCYVNGWLERFLHSVEETDWLEVILPGDAVRDVAASGPVYIPVASYREMGDWTLSSDEMARLGNLREHLEQTEFRIESERFLRGGIWRNFLSKYPESNELHKRVLHAEKSVYSSGDTDALHHFWRSQCNCAYWHGVFGGLYLPHLREAVWTELHLAESISHDVLGDLPSVTEDDIDSDGRKEILVLGGNMSMLIRPEMGLTVSEFSYVPDEGMPVPMGHVLTRKREPYHCDIGTETVSEEVRSIHDSVGMTPAGLSSAIVIDTRRRLSFADLVVPDGLSMEHWCGSGDRLIHFYDAQVNWHSRQGIERLEISSDMQQTGYSLSKVMMVSLTEPLIEVRSEYAGENGNTFRAGMEFCLNMLTGSEPDRVIRIDDDPPVMLGRQGSSTEPARRIVIEDRQRDVSVEIIPRSPVDVWFCPLDSVSRSEQGYEKVHQGVAVYVSTSTGNIPECSIVLTVRIGRSSQ